MVSPNWSNERYSPAPHEQCCRCGEQLGEAGAYYWDRIRVCRRCYHDEIEWQSEDRTIQEAIAFERMLRGATWWAICLLASAFVLACAMRLFL